jgi:hypothetical protein
MRFFGSSLLIITLLVALTGQPEHRDIGVKGWPQRKG